MQTVCCYKCGKKLTPSGYCLACKCYRDNPPRVVLLPTHWKLSAGKALEVQGSAQAGYTIFKCICSKPFLPLSAGTFFRGYGWRCKDCRPAEVGAA